MIRRRLIAVPAAAAFAAALVSTGSAQGGCPARQFRYVIADAPGGAKDTLARTVAQRLSEQGVEVSASTPEAFGSYMLAETPQRAKDVQGSGAKAD